MLLDQLKPNVIVRGPIFPEPVQVIVWHEKRAELPLSVSDSRLSSRDIGSDHVQVVAGGFECLLGIVMRNKPGVVIKGHIALPTETIKDGQQAGIFLVDTRPHKIDDGDVVTRLASRTESMAEHEPEGSLEHCFVGLLKTSLLVKSRSVRSDCRLRPSCWPLLPRARFS